MASSPVRPRLRGAPAQGCSISVTASSTRLPADRIGAVLALGLAAAIGASALFMLGVALQTLDAREAPREDGLRLGLIARLLRHPRWVLGTVVGVAGFPLQVAAFAWAP